MKLRIRELRILVQTAIGEFGVKLSLQNGLTVIRADNSSGKSTIVQSMIYGLGLEGMLSASRSVPLPHAITHMIDAEDGSRHEVISSEVQLEFSNHDGHIVTTIRRVKGALNHNLITVVHGPAISAPDPVIPYELEDKYVRDRGAATKPEGFHYWLSTFLGWTLPQVTTFDGKSCPLYIESMFPLILIEQKKAWTGIQARMPTQFQIRDASKRAIEFILKLSVFELIAKAQQLRDAKAEIQRQWQRWTLEASSAARQAGGIINGLTEMPMKQWSVKEPVTLMLYRDNRWVDINQAKQADQTEIDSLISKEIPEVSAVSDQLTAQLREVEEELQTIQVTLVEAIQDVSAKRVQMTGLEARLVELADDLAGNKSVRKLRTMGARYIPKIVTDHRCPTCHQNVDESLLPQDNAVNVMSLEDSINFIEAQQEIYNAAKGSLIRAISVINAEIAALREKEAEIRARIRALKTSLVSEGHAPSRAAIEALQVAQARLARTIEAENIIEVDFSQLKSLCSQWLAVTEELKKLPDDYLTKDDQRKIKTLEMLFQSHATAFDVRSVAPKDITLSRESYKPEYKGFDLEFDLSASDLIRTIWAYLHSLLELAREEDTNHPGLLVLDEPRQQDTNRESFASFFVRAQTSADFDQQVIVTTSEKEEELKRILDGVAHRLIEFKTDHILTRVPSQGNDSQDLPAKEEVDTPLNDAPQETKTAEASDDDDIPF